MKAGVAIPVLERAIALPDMVAYGGATWDWHRLHYDDAWVRARGMTAPVVDGQMLGALMAEQLLDWLGPRAFITNLSFRFRSMVSAGEHLRIEGEVTGVEDGHVRVAQRVLAGDRLTVEGTARVRL